MIASLPMYDRPETAAAHDAFWALIRDHAAQEGLDLPPLTRGDDLWAQWEDPRMILSLT